MHEFLTVSIGTTILIAIYALCFLTLGVGKAFANGVQLRSLDWEHTLLLVLMFLSLAQFIVSYGVVGLRVLDGVSASPGQFNEVKWYGVFGLLAALLSLSLFQLAIPGDKVMFNTRFVAISLFAGASVLFTALLSAVLVRIEGHHYIHAEGLLTLTVTAKSIFALLFLALGVQQYLRPNRTLRQIVITLGTLGVAFLWYRLLGPDLAP